MHADVVAAAAMAAAPSSHGKKAPACDEEPLARIGGRSLVHIAGDFVPQFRAFAVHEAFRSVPYRARVHAKANVASSSARRSSIARGRGVPLHGDPGGATSGPNIDAAVTSASVSA